MIFKNSRVYDVLKWLALVFFEAFGIFYKGVSGTWGLPYGDQIKETCIHLSMFIGVLIGVSGIRYQMKNGANQPNNDKIDPEAEELINGNL